MCFHCLDEDGNVTSFFRSILEWKERRSSGVVDGNDGESAGVWVVVHTVPVSGQMFL